MRAFIALSPPEALRAALAAAQHGLAASGADVKWVEPANLHLTLKFLGDITEAQGTAIRQALHAIAEHTAPFTLRAEGVGAFPSLGAPRVIWVGLAGDEGRLPRMAALIERAAQALGVPAEERGFSAHLTLGRVRSPRGRGALAERLRESAWRDATPWRVESVTLYQSRLSSAGPAYSILADLKLTGG